MEYRPQLKAGIYMATQSFSMLWYNRKLLLYFGIPALLILIIKLIAYNFFALLTIDNPLHLLETTQKLFQNIMLSQPEWVKFIATASIYLATMAVMTFFNAALIHHIVDTMEGKTSSVRSNLTACLPKLPLILKWALITVAVELIIVYSAENISSLTLLLLIGAIILAWFIATFFVMPILIINNQSIKDAILLSIAVLTQLWAETAGGLTWFGLTILVVLFPLLTIKLTIPTLISGLLKTPALYQIALFLGFFGTEIILRCILSSAYAIFKVMLYQEYIRKNPSPLEKLSYERVFPV